MKKSVKILLEVTVRDFTKEECAEEGYEPQDCRGATSDFDVANFADAVAEYIVEAQDELLAGSDAMVKIVSVKGSKP